jgi:CubicO group peptidase (beta-lactamase class C family)
MTKDLNKINPGPFGSTVTNFAVIEKSGVAFECAGVRDFMDKDPKKVDADTMFGEGSIGKIRFAGLAYMLQQEGIINLQGNAGAFFARREFGEFLSKKYPDKASDLKAAIVGFFSGSSASATLADLTTHRSVVGDLTRDGGRLIAAKGVEHECTIPELILQGKHSNPELRIGSKIRAQGPEFIADKDLPMGEYGEHQYSNLGYMLLGLAMEQAYANKYPDKPLKDYKQLMKDFMLDPIEVCAAGQNIKFSSTKFPEDIAAEDNVVKANWVEDRKLVDGNKVSSANAAGGIFASANDSTRFFEEFFAGFPGTEKNGKNANNKFFKPETIELMRQEWMKYPPANQPKLDKTKTPPDFLRFQGPGFAVDYPYSESYYSDPEKFFTENLPNNYIKNGGTFGYNSQIKFNPQTGNAFINVKAQENLTAEVAKQSDVKISSVMACYSKSGEFDRYKMLKTQMPDLLEQRESVKKLDLKRQDQEKSFVEKMMGNSKGGYHEV